ncbi:MAG: DUF445 family protein [Pseudomonadota bacterium]
MSEEIRKRELARTRMLATGLLLVMVVIFLIATSFQANYPWLGYLRAFTEAAMIGGIADWFAVTALFRRPLGLPIPHTAVIPRNKDRIGESLGNFVETHFFPKEVIEAKLANIDFAGLLANWLVDPKNATVISERIAGLLPHFLRALGDEEMRKLLRDQITTHIDEIDIAPLSGTILTALTVNNQHQALLDEAVKQSVALLIKKEPQIRERIRDATHWIWQKLSLDEKAFNVIMKAVQDVLHDLEKDPNHELRQQFDQAVQNFIRNLKDSPEYRDRAETIKREIVHNPLLQDYFSGIWDDIKRRMLLDIDAPDSEIKTRLQLVVIQFGETLISNTAFQDQFNGWLRKLIGDVIESRRHEIAQLIPETVHTWNAQTMSQRLELQVGKDLQFIRINGTFVGGLIGLLIYVGSLLI